MNNGVGCKQEWRFVLTQKMCVNRAMLQLIVKSIYVTVQKAMKHNLIICDRQFPCSFWVLQNGPLANLEQNLFDHLTDQEKNHLQNLNNFEPNSKNDKK